MPRKTTKKKQDGPSKKRSKDAAVASAVEGTPPDPPPPPPAALVKLIQKNKSVLKYFQALQENLDYDVQKWKLRARKYQADSLEWKAKAEARVEAQRNSASVETTSSKKRAAGPSLEDEEEMDQPQRQRLRTEDQSMTTDKSQSTRGHKSKEAIRESTVSSAGSASSENKSNHGSQPDKLPGDETTKNSSLKPSATEDDDWLDLASLSSEDAEEETNGNHKTEAPSQGQSTVPPLSILAMSSEDSEEDDDEAEDFDEPSSRPASTQKPAPLNILALSSDGSSEDEDDDDSSTGWLESQFPDNRQAQQKLPPPGRNLRNEANSQVLQSVKKANELLLQLGISLIEETPGVPQEEQKGEDGDEDSEAETGQPKVILQRRSDACVLSDLLQSIKALVRIHTFHKEEEELLESYYPFMTTGLIPCFMPDETISERSSPPHPAIEGVQSLSNAFHLMETYCSSLDEIEDEDLDDDQTLVLGMKDRHTMISNLLRSLEGEICQLWPVQDRATRLVTTSLHFEATSDEENDVVISQSKRVEGDKIAAPTKNLPRLAALAERCFLAQLVSRMHLARQDPRALFQFFWRYLMATTPAIGIGSHHNPFKLQPIQSICVLESILCNDIENANHVLASHWTEDKADWKWISRTVCLLVEVTAAIQVVRRDSKDERIADTARVELAAKARLEAKHPFWKDYSPLEAEDDDTIQRISEELRTMTKDLMHVGENGDVSPTMQTMLLPALLVTLGEAKSVDNLFTNAAKKLDMETTLACVNVKKCLEIRMMEKHRKVVLSRSTLVEGGMRLWDYSKAILKAFHPHSNDDQQEFMEFAKLTLASCLELADGESAVKVLEACLTRLDTYSHNNVRKPMLSSSTLNMMETIRQAIVVRVINLERRPDRLASFLAQAAAHGNLLVLRGVLDASSIDDTTTMDGSFGYALDGGNGRPAEIEKRLAGRLDCTLEEMSSRLVQTRWRPNDLQIFDTEAPDSLEEVRISPSEKACALSHIACWKGVVKSLEMMKKLNGGEAQPKGTTIIRNPLHWRQRFQISGYAKGPPLFPENEGMPPAPVCIILEDDAILVDRFSDRLDAVLEELPRDFHFCSIGYSRPKTAPLIPYYYCCSSSSSEQQQQQISIPSSIWYLTGYIISLEGCRYLLDQLPVRGPVDSWIGMKMFGNWDNLYGHAMGVGMSNKNKNNNNKSSNTGGSDQDKTISRKDLRKLLKFRAFCATVPLCSQKVGAGMGGATNNSNSSSGERNWRNRDTDIVYSGNSIK